MFKKVHPNREAWAREAEREAERARREGGQHTNPKANELLRTVAQLLDGRAVALRGPEPVMIMSFGRQLLTYADGTYDEVVGG